MSLFLNKTTILNKDKEQLKLALMGALPCVRLACATSGYWVTVNEPHLPPQHYELNTKQHMLDRTRVSVSRQYSKATRSTSLGEVAAQT